MNLKCVTLTGADDSVVINDLIKISEEFPFVEWGILFSKNKQGESRYPSLNWLQELEYVNTLKINFSAHLCGSYAREHLTGVAPHKFPKWYDSFESIEHKFGRIQLNVSPYLKDYTPDVLAQNLVGSLRGVRDEVVIQSHAFDEKSKLGMVSQVRRQTKFSVLLDKSGGKGIFSLDDLLVKPNPNYPCGYAGGLSVDNLAIVMEKVSEIAEDNPIWFDMESSLRKDDKFCLETCRRVLEIASKFVKTA